MSPAAPPGPSLCTTNTHDGDDDDDDNDDDDDDDKTVHSEGQEGVAQLLPHNGLTCT